jgi:hypothetical protein
VWLIYIAFFSFLQDCTAGKSQAYFIVLRPSLSANLTICLHFHFLVSRPGMGGIYSPISFCLYVVALSVYRANNVWDRVQD